MDHAPAVDLAHPAARQGERGGANPRVYNVTAVRQASDTRFYGGRLRRNTGGQWHNVIVAGAKNAPIFIDGGTAQANAAGGVLTFDHSILFGDFAKYPAGVNGAPTIQHLFTTYKNNRNVDPKLAIGEPTLLKTLMPDLMPLEGSPALDADFAGNPPDDGFLVPTDYLGAVGPGDNWLLTGWATFSDNEGEIMKVMQPCCFYSLSRRPRSRSRTARRSPAPTRTASVSPS